MTITEVSGNTQHNRSLYPAKLSWNSNDFCSDALAYVSVSLGRYGVEILTIRIHVNALWKCLLSDLVC